MKTDSLSSRHADGSTKLCLAAFSCTTNAEGENEVQGNLINNSQHPTARWAQAKSPEAQRFHVDLNSRYLHP